jgi:hypothetical protein
VAVAEVRILLLLMQDLEGLAHVVWGELQLLLLEVEEQLIIVRLVFEEELEDL